MIIECADGTFGYNCTSNCSGHCQNDSSCNKQTGHCARGCNPGYTNDDCNKGKFADEHFAMNKPVFSLIVSTKNQLLNAYMYVR